MKRILFLAWQDPARRKWYPVGRLVLEHGLYIFEYIKGALDAEREAGFEPIHSFPEFDARYESEDLFPIFSNRVLPRSRPEYNDVLRWLDVASNDSVGILSRSGGQRATDTFEVFPYPEANNAGEYQIFFLVHGLSHMSTDAIVRAEMLVPGERLLLMKDFQNPVDSHALALRTAERHPGDLHIVGYCPRYLQSDVLRVVDRDAGIAPKVFVERVNLAAPMQFRVLCRMDFDKSGSVALFSGEEYEPLISSHTDSNQLLLA